MTDRTLTVQASATREQIPELATVEVTAIGEAESVSGARAAAEDHAHTIRDAVTAAPTDRIQTVDIRVEDTDEMFTPDGDARYQSTEKLQIACAAETAEDVVMEVADAGGRVQMVEFRVHEDLSQELREEALVAATKKARRKADGIAAAEGLSITHIEEITTGEASSEMGSIVDTALESYENENFYPAPVTISESITVTYALESETA
jgi:uncharacterized protein YggE